MAVTLGGSWDMLPKKKLKSRSSERWFLAFWVYMLFISVFINNFIQLNSFLIDNDGVVLHCMCHDNMGYTI